MVLTLLAACTAVISLFHLIHLKKFYDFVDGFLRIFDNVSAAQISSKPLCIVAFTAYLFVMVVVADGKIPPEVVRAAADQTLALNPADAVHVSCSSCQRNQHPPREIVCCANRGEASAFSNPEAIYVMSSVSGPV